MGIFPIADFLPAFSLANFLDNPGTSQPGFFLDLPYKGIFDGFVVILYASYIRVRGDALVMISDWWRNGYAKRTVVLTSW